MDDHTLPFSTIEQSIHGEHYSLVWETETLKQLGSALNILAVELASTLIQQGLQVTILPVLAALSGPFW